MSYKTGNSKSLDNIVLQDVLDYPIWEWALGEEFIDEQDETWQRPILNTDNVTAEMYSPTITLKIKNSDIIASGEFDHEKNEISAISIWKNDQWEDLSQCPNEAPIILISIPKINGVTNMEFICKNKAVDRAVTK